MNADEDFPFELKEEPERTGELEWKELLERIDNLAAALHEHARRVDKIDTDMLFVKARLEDQVELMKQFINRFKGE